MWVRFLGWEDLLGMATHSVFLPGEYHGQRNLAGYSPWGRRESDMTEATTSLVMLPVITIIRNIMGSNSCPRSDNGEPSLRLCAME